MEQEEKWSKEFRETFANYASHDRLHEPAYIVWAVDFISKLLVAERQKMAELIYKTDKLDHYCECEGEHFVSFKIKDYDDLKRKLEQLK